MTCAGCDGIPNSGKINDACGECDGDGSTCVAIARLEPNAIAEDTSTVTVYGAGLDGEIVTCFVYNESGSEIAQLTGWISIFDSVGYRLF